MIHQFSHPNNYTLISRGTSRRTATILCKPFGYQISIRHSPGVKDKIGQVVKNAALKSKPPINSSSVHPSKTHTPSITSSSDKANTPSVPPKFPDTKVKTTYNNKKDDTKINKVTQQAKQVLIEKAKQALIEKEKLALSQKEKLTPSTSESKIGGYNQVQSGCVTGALASWSQDQKEALQKDNATNTPVPKNKVVTDVAPHASSQSLPQSSIKDELKKIPLLQPSIKIPQSVSFNTSLPSHVASSIEEPVSLPVATSTVIPPAPPLPKEPLYKAYSIVPPAPIDAKGNSITQSTFAKQIEAKALEKQKQRNLIVQELETRDLKDSTKDTLTLKGNSLLPKREYQEKVQINIPDSVVSNTSFGLGTLRISQIEETVTLKGLHTHVTVLHSTQDNKILIWAFLTSAKFSTTFQLSDFQPFNYTSKKDQQIAVLDKPFIASQDDIEKMPELPWDSQKNKEVTNETNKDAIIIKDQAKIAEQYLQKPEVQQILKTLFNDQIIPKIKKENGIIPLYDGTSVTEEDCNNLLNAHNEEVDKQVKKLFKEYKQKKNQLNKPGLTEWFSKTKKFQGQYVYDELQKFIKDHEDN